MSRQRKISARTNPLLIMKLLTFSSHAEGLSRVGGRGGMTIWPIAAASFSASLGVRLVVVTRITGGAGGVLRRSRPRPARPRCLSVR